MLNKIRQRKFNNFKKNYFRLNKLYHFESNLDLNFYNINLFITKNELHIRNENLIELDPEMLDLINTAFEADIYYLHNDRILNTYCHSKILFCFIALLDGRPKYQSISDFANNFLTFQNFANNYKNNTIEFGWVNSTCQYSLIENFKQSSGYEIFTPNVIIYVPLLKSFAAMNLEITTENLVSFIEYASKKRLPFHNFINYNSNSNNIHINTILNCLLFDEENPENEIIVANEQELDIAYEKVINYYNYKRKEYDKYLIDGRYLDYFK